MAVVISRSRGHATPWANNHYRLSLLSRMASRWGCLTVCVERRDSRRGIGRCKSPPREVSNVATMTAPTGLLPNTRAPTPKIFRLGTHRAVRPEETVERVRPFMAAMGITRIANITGLDRIGVPVVMVCRPNSRSLAVSQGKGLDLAAAKASGLMESVEDYHAERIALPLKLGSYEELRHSHRLVDVTKLPRTTSSRFHPSLPVLWIEGYDLLQQEPVWVPHDLVHMRYTLPRL